MNTDSVYLGCVADDFTGAGDIASFLVQNGLPTILCNGIPKGDVSIENSAAIVIALKTRSIEPEAAISETRSAFHWLREHGAKHLYFKYCSTFDSTPTGNIGPVIDSMLQEEGIPYTVLCPSLPVNHRTVRDGHLYVNGIPLHESSMRSHPLNPMWDSSIARLMEPQGQYSTMVLPASVLSVNKEDILKKIKEFGKDNRPFYVVPDYENEEQGHKIAEVFSELPFLTGGSGLGAHLADVYRQQGTFSGNTVIGGTQGRGIILSGSCSKATAKQIETFIQQGGTSFFISPQKLLSGEETVDRIWQFVQEHSESDVLLYSAAGVADEKCQTGDAATQKQYSQILENTVAEIAQRACAAGIKRIIVAGGETSGAVAQGLGIRAYRIGEVIAPGVPLMAPLEHPEMRIVLKSGNFGNEDFFLRALKMTGVN